MDWNLIITFFVGGGLGGVIAAYVAIRMLKPNIRKIDADTTGVLSDAFVDLLTASQAERVAWAAERDALKKRIDAMEADQEIHRINRNAEIDELKAKIQSDLLDTRELRIASVEDKRRISHLEDIVIRQCEYSDIQNTFMKKAGIPVPQNGELLESARRLKLTREQREQLKGAGK